MSKDLSLEQTNVVLNKANRIKVSNIVPPLVLAILAIEW